MINNPSKLPIILFLCAILIGSVFSVTTITTVTAKTQHHTNTSTATAFSSNQAAAAAVATAGNAAASASAPTIPSLQIPLEPPASSSSSSSSTTTTPPTAEQQQQQQDQQSPLLQLPATNNNNNNPAQPIFPATSLKTKVAMINFDDAWQSQFTLAKPILDRLGMKASFFIPCAHVSLDPRYLTWQQVLSLKNDGMDIESHTMTHKHLTDDAGNPQTDPILNYEIGEPVNCFNQHGINVTIFGYPLSLGQYNPHIVDIISKYYRFARAGDEPAMMLDCNGYNKLREPVPQPQNCAPLTVNDGTKMIFSNKFNVKSKSFYHITAGGINYNEDQMFMRFQARLLSAEKSNAKAGVLNAIPIIVYHDLTNNMQAYNTGASTVTVQEFTRELQFLHDQGYTIKLLSDLDYNNKNNTFFLAK